MGLFNKLLFIFIVGLLGCTKAPQDSEGISPPSTKKKSVVDVNQINFSKYPGVIKPAAFGYFFGLTPKQIESAGISLEEKNSAGQNGSIRVYTTSNAPSGWSNAEGYNLIFYKDQLLKIRAFGKDINADSSGSEGKKQFKELEDALIEKYEESKRYHYSGNKLYQEKDEFYQCLAYDGCGSWVNIWEKPDRSIVLELHGSGRGSGYIDITYEASPEWSQALEIIKTDEKLKTKQGL